MTERIVETRGKDPQLQLNNYCGVRSPDLLAKWPMIGLFVFLFGRLGFGGLFYNLLTHNLLLQWDRMLATTLPAISFQNLAILKPSMDAGYYKGGGGFIILTILFGLYFIAKRCWQGMAMVVIGMEGQSLLFLSLSNSIGRLRLPTQILIISKIPGFPSGHLTVVVVLFGFLAYLLIPKVHSAFGKGFVVAVAIQLILFVGFYPGIHRRTLFDRYPLRLCPADRLVGCGLNIDQNLFPKKKESKCQKRINPFVLN